MNGPRDQLLPCSRISQNQYRGIAGRNRSCLGQHPLQRRAFSHNLFEIKFGTDFLFEIEFFAGQLVGKLCDLAVGSGIVQRHRHLRRDLLQKANVWWREGVRLFAGKIQGAKLAFARGQRNTAQRANSVFQHLADVSWIEFPSGLHA